MADGASGLPGSPQSQAAAQAAASPPGIEFFQQRLDRATAIPPAQRPPEVQGFINSVALLRQADRLLPLHAGGQPALPFGAPDTVRREALGMLLFAHAYYLAPGDLQWEGSRLNTVGEYLYRIAEGHFEGYGAAWQPLWGVLKKVNLALRVESPVVAVCMLHQLAVESAGPLVHPATSAAVDRQIAALLQASCDLLPGSSTAAPGSTAIPTAGSSSSGSGGEGGSSSSSNSQPPALLQDCPPTTAEQLRCTCLKQILRLGQTGLRRVRSPAGLLAAVAAGGRQEAEATAHLSIPEVSDSEVAVLAPATFAAAEALVQLEPDNPAALFQAAHAIEVIRPCRNIPLAGVRADRVGLAPALRLTLRALRAAQRQRSDYWTVICSSVAVVLAGSPDTDLSHSELAEVVAACEGVDAALRCCGRLLPQLWVTEAKGAVLVGKSSLSLARTKLSSSTEVGPEVHMAALEDMIARRQRPGAPDSKQASMCAGCNQQAIGLRRCSRCKSHTAQYCSRECQVRHWRAHKLVCKPAAGSSSRA